MCARILLGGIVFTFAVSVPLAGQIEVGPNVHVSVEYRDIPHEEVRGCGMDAPCARAS